MINNHKLMGENLIKYSGFESISLINKNRFIWGNVKPDCTPKYKKMKHYYNESSIIIIPKIEYLSSLNIHDIIYGISIEKFSEELGIVCHFLCDYFCVPHYYRWECTNTKVMKDHIIYEKHLATKTKKFIPDNIELPQINPNEVSKFLVNLQDEYKLNIGYNNDLKFSYYACQSILKMIIDRVLTNKINIKKVI